MRDNITLPNGTVLSWDEFSSLPEQEQDRITKELNRETERYWSVNPEANGLPDRRELLPRLRAAAERNAFKEEDLLAFIKVMHDIFFPPEPKKVVDGVEVLPGKAHRTNVKGAFMNLSKPVITPAGEFPSMAAAGRYFSVEGSRIRCWVKDPKKPEFYLKK